MLESRLSQQTILACLLVFPLFTPTEAAGQFTTVLNVEDAHLPFSIGSDTQLNVTSGAPDKFQGEFNAGAVDGSSTNIEVNIFSGDFEPGSTMNFHAGSTGNIFDAAAAGNINLYSGGVMNISGGTIGGSGLVLSNEAGSVVNISGGIVNLDSDGEVNISNANLVNINATSNNVTNISGGTTVITTSGEVNIAGGSATFNDANNGSVVNQYGGTIGIGFDANPGSTVNIAGGNVLEDFDAASGSGINYYGTSFIFDNNDITHTMTPNVPVTLTQRNVNLGGVLADGSPFALTLYSDDQPNRESFQPGSTVTITLRLPGDLNLDGFVGIDDLNIVLSSWNQEVSPANPTADPTVDGFVGIDDLNVVLGNWNAGTPPVAGSVPEPGKLGLAVILGVAGLSGRTHARRAL